MLHNPLPGVNRTASMSSGSDGSLGPVNAMTDPGVAASGRMKWICGAGQMSGIQQSRARGHVIEAS